MLAASIDRASRDSFSSISKQAVYRGSDDPKFPKSNASNPGAGVSPFCTCLLAVSRQPMCHRLKGEDAHGITAALDLLLSTLEPSGIPRAVHFDASDR